MRKTDTFQVANRLKLAHRWVQILLILSFILGINHLALRHFVRFDLTRDNRFALSPETRAYLRDIDQPLHIVVTIPKNSPRGEEQVLFRYVEQLLQEYTYQSRQKGDFLITTEFVDIYQDLARAETLSSRYGLDQPNSVLVLSENRKRLVRADELVQFSNREPVAFTGESALSSAIIEVTQETSPVLYFLQGHNEVPPDDPSPRNGLSQIANELQLRNFTIRLLDLTSVDKVPDDAAVLVIAHPKGPLLGSEIDKVRAFLSDRAGRVLAWTGPGFDTGLDPLLREWGVRLPDEVVIEPDPSFRETTGTLLVRNYGEHPITKTLIENQTFLVSSLPRPVLPAPPEPPDERLQFVPLFATSASSWSETTWRSDGDPSFNPETEIKGPVPIAFAAQRKADSALGISVPGGRLVLFGSPDLFSNNRVSSLGNVSLFFNTLNWMLDRDRMLVIPPRPVDTYRLSLSEEQLRRIAFLFLAVPGSIGLAGLLVYWLRKS